MMLISNNNKWIYENPLSKNKNQRYYYDFGTGIKEEWDVRARWAGVKYYYEKNNKLPLYYYLYGNKIKY